MQCVLKQSKKKAFTQNFSSLKEQVLYSLIAKYKGVVENRKTNSAKNQFQKQIKDEFNVACAGEAET